MQNIRHGGVSLLFLHSSCYNVHTSHEMLLQVPGEACFDSSSGAFSSSQLRRSFLLDMQSSREALSPNPRPPSKRWLQGLLAAEVFLLVEVVQQPPQSQKMTANRSRNLRSWPSSETCQSARAAGEAGETTWTLTSASALNLWKTCHDSKRWNDLSSDFWKSLCDVFPHSSTSNPLSLSWFFNHDCLCYLQK